MTKGIGYVCRDVLPTDFLPLSVLLTENSDSATVRNFHPFEMTGATAELICKHSGKDRYFIAVSGMRIHGLSMLRGLDEGYDIPSFGVVVDQAHRSKGLGLALTRHAISEAKSMGCVRVRLTVYRNNLKAMRMYVNLGFCEVGRSAANVFGEQDVKVTMQLDLKNFK